MLQFTILTQGCDAAYLTNLHSEFEAHEDFVKGEDARNWDKQFGIRHYAGVVTYSVSGFVDKNRDTQQDVFFDSLGKSKSPFIHELCQFKVHIPDFVYILSLQLLLYVSSSAN